MDNPKELFLKELDDIEKFIFNKNVEYIKSSDTREFNLVDFLEGLGYPYVWSLTKEEQVILGGKDYRMCCRDLRTKISSSYELYCQFKSCMDYIIFTLLKRM